MKTLGLEVSLKPKKQRPSYKRAVEFVALNFAPSSAEELESDITVSLIVELFGVDVAKVARDIVKARG